MGTYSDFLVEVLLERDAFISSEVGEIHIEEDEGSVIRYYTPPFAVKIQQLVNSKQQCESKQSLATLQLPNLECYTLASSY